jgi:hypothetical protein
MDFLRGIGTIFASGIVRLLVVAGTMLLAYLLFVRPALDTTNEAIKQFNVQPAIRQANRQIQQAVQKANAPQHVPGQVQITRTLHGLTPHKARVLTRCIQTASGNPTRINRCFDRASRKRR